MLKGSKVISMTSAASHGQVVLYAGFAGSSEERAYKPDAEGRLWSEDLAEIELLVRLYNPAKVISPLIAANFDCVDLAQTLQSCGFKGSYCAESPSDDVGCVVATEIAELDVEFEFAILPKDLLFG